VYIVTSAGPNYRNVGWGERDLHFFFFLFFCRPLLLKCRLRWKRSFGRPSTRRTFSNPSRCVCVCMCVCVCVCVCVHVCGDKQRGVWWKRHPASLRWPLCFSSSCVCISFIYSACVKSIYIYIYYIYMNVYIDVCISCPDPTACLSSSSVCKCYVYILMYIDLFVLFLYPSPCRGRLHTHTHTSIDINIYMTHTPPPPVCVSYIYIHKCL
jgi:hypothetical protein